MFRGGINSALRSAASGRHKLGLAECRLSLALTFLCLTSVLLRLGVTVSALTRSRFYGLSICSVLYILPRYEPYDTQYTLLIFCLGLCLLKTATSTSLIEIENVNCFYVLALLMIGSAGICLEDNHEKSSKLHIYALYNNFNALMHYTKIAFLACFVYCERNAVSKIGFSLSNEGTPL